MAYLITDSFDGGNSEILNVINKHEEVGIRYVLKDGYVFPYVGLALEVSDSKGIGVFRYDMFEMSVKASRKMSLKVNILTSPKTNGTFSESKPAFFYYTTVIDVKPDYSTVRIPITEFKVPEWWLIKNNLSKESIARLDENPIRMIEVLTSTIDELGAQQEFLIRNIHVKKNVVFYAFSASAAALVLFGILLILYEITVSRNAVKEAKDIIRIHKHLDLGNEKEHEAAKLFDYLTSHYNDPYISVSSVSEELHISAYKIPKIVYQYTDMTFKQYINLLRVEEAKSQLVSGTSKIIDIAYAIGYNSIAHF
ncbi:MAG: helix-turn-helix domain-containing protein, partial [Spirochaetota bacterium]